MKTAPRCLPPLPSLPLPVCLPALPLPCGSYALMVPVMTMVLLPKAISSITSEKQEGLFHMLTLQGMPRTAYWAASYASAFTQSALLVVVWLLVGVLSGRRAVW